MKDSGSIYRVRFVPKERRFNTFTRAMIWLSGFQLAANGLLQIYGNGWENPIFIPLGFVEFVPEREYGPDDPEYAMYMKFRKDPRRALEGKSEPFPPLRRPRLGMVELELTAL